MMALLVDAVDEYAIFMLDPDGMVATWNTGAQRIKGYSHDEILGRHFSVFYTLDDIRAGRPDRQLEQAVARGHVHDEGWRVRRDGSRFWADVTITAIFDLNGWLEGFAKVTRDDTDRKKLHEHARELELANDRERIALAMHETIVHRILEASMTMEGILGLIDNPIVAERIAAAVASLDATLQELRTIVLGLDT
jgi:PAS domain S-box-containing protein